MVNKLDWIFKLKDDIPLFLNKLKDKEKSGFYHYSLSGDYFSKNIKWGLGNAVFFLKIVYTLNLESRYKKEIGEAIEFVKSFQKKDGEISDNFLNLISIPFKIRRAIQSKNIEYIFSRQTKRAETRQSFSVLALFNRRAKYQYKKIPKTKKEIKNYLDKLNWSTPWGAGSHFSHLLFFLNLSDAENKQELIDYAIEWINEMQHSEDGFWYKGNPSTTQKINGAMKIITGFKAVNRVSFKYPEKIIDSCLDVQNDRHACDNFNITYVLKYCLEQSNKKYKVNKIKSFMLNRLALYRKYYHDDKKGFSFKKNKANRFYYSALITKGKNEPDIHGTVLFLWGISLIVQVLEINDKLEFNEFIT